EADETAYWLELLVGSGYIDDSMYRSLERDLNEIIALLTASINTARANMVQ
ncbi:MAG: four helix bundle protein, partial [Alistipes sp.]|nr:four helix bundle protein [Alistipes sp.]